MQQKSNIFFSAKERILQYLVYKNISQYDFSKKTGLSNGFLKSGSSISSDNIKLISNIYADLNIIWVITGEGEMLKNTPKETAPIADESEHTYYNSIIEKKDAELCAKDAEIRARDAEIREINRLNQQTVESINMLLQVLKTQREEIEALKRELKIFQTSHKNPVTVRYPELSSPLMDAAEPQAEYSKTNKK
ncbi:MAG: hypothetical protein LBL04_14115 [Bacteroidales bacterium]|jgi:hypothetical protein|nr:hypothetical protein [Bacteroidales bacterium]